MPRRPPWHRPLRPSNRPTRSWWTNCRTTWSDAPACAAAWTRCRARRQELLALRTEGRQPTPQQGTGPWGAATKAYAEALLLLRNEYQADWSHTTDADRDSRALREGLVEPAANLGLRLYRLVTADLQGYAGAVLPSEQRLSADLLAEARTVMSLSRPLLDRARATIPSQAQTIDDARSTLEQLLDLSAALGRRRAATSYPLAAAAPAELGAGLGLDEARYARQGRQALAAAAQLEQVGLEALQQRLAERHAQLRSTLFWQASALGISLLATLYLLVCMFKVVDGGLRYLGAQVAQLGLGNLSIRPVGHGKDEVGQALTALGQSAAQMSALFEAVNQGVASVSHAAREVATGNAGLNGRTGDIRQAIGNVAGRTESFASAMELCSDAVERVAEHVRSMRLEAQRGRKATASLHAQMRSLQGKSREIVQVVTLVEAVAHQTKLLALNASVEAARAGPAGKGFAVVAQEVRGLALRSEGAARRIREIVDASVAEIGDGSRTAERVGEAVGRTDQEIESVNAIMGEIVSMVRDSQQQSHEVLGIAREVDDAAGGNARIVQQLSDASAGLRDQGDSLKRALQHFVTA